MEEGANSHSTTLSLSRLPEPDHGGQAGASHVTGVHGGTYTRESTVLTTTQSGRPYDHLPFYRWRNMDTEAFSNLSRSHNEATEPGSAPGPPSSDRGSVSRTAGEARPTAS